MSFSFAERQDRILFGGLGGLRFGDPLDGACDCPAVPGGPARPSHSREAFAAAAEVPLDFAGCLVHRGADGNPAVGEEGQKDTPPLEEVVSFCCRSGVPPVLLLSETLTPTLPAGPFLEDLAQAAHGRPVLLASGNRDFLLAARRFRDRAGAGWLTTGLTVLNEACNLPDLCRDLGASVCLLPRALASG